MDGSVNGMDGAVSALAFTQFGNLFVGGGFTKAGSVSANKITNFVSGKWVALDQGLEGINSFVSSIIVSGPDEFTQAEILKLLVENLTTTLLFGKLPDGKILALNLRKGLINLLMQ